MQWEVVWDWGSFWVSHLYSFTYNLEEKEKLELWYISWSCICYTQCLKSIFYLLTCGPQKTQKLVTQRTESQSINFGNKMKKSILLAIFLSFVRSTGVPKKCTTQIALVFLLIFLWFDFFQGNFLRFQEIHLQCKDHHISGFFYL